MTEEFVILKNYLDAGEKLSTEEWKKLLTSGKDFLKARVTSWKVILKIEDSQAEGSVRRTGAMMYRKKVEEEIKDLVEELTNLNNHLAAAEDGEGNIMEFCLKMRDECSKNLAVVTDRHDLRLNELPDSVLQYVFSFLDVETLKAVRLVSRRWKYVVEIPRLWSKVYLAMATAKHQDILNSDLIKFVVSAIVSCRFKARKALDLVNSGIKSLALFGCTVNSGSSELFQAISKLEEFTLNHCHVSSECLTAMFEARYSSAGKPKTLFISGRNENYEVELDEVELDEEGTALSTVALLEKSGLDLEPLGFLRFSQDTVIISN